MLTPVRHVMDVVGYVDLKDIIHSINGHLEGRNRRFPILDTGQGLRNHAENARTFCH
jgi:hypothetical protein